MVTTLIVLMLATVGHIHSTEIKRSVCEEISNYTCNETSYYINLYRPDVNGNVRFRIQKDMWFHFYIECEKPAQFNYKIFPQLHLKLNKTFLHITNCTIPENNSFGSMLEHFGIKKLFYFSAIKMGHSVQHLFSSGCENIDSLTVSSNELEHLNENVFDSLIMLIWFNLSSNNISVLPKNVFKRLHNLEWLSLEDNQIEQIEEGIFRNQNKLIFLGLSNNKLRHLTKEIFAGLSALKVLNLHDNNFKSLASDVFCNLSLMDIYFGNKNVKYEIAKNIFENNYDLEVLTLERVTIPNGFKINYMALKTISIKFCEFDQIDGSNKSNLTKFSKHSSYERSVHSPSVDLFANQKNTTDLDLSNNEITDLHDGLFDSLKELYRLNLSHNNLTTISGLIFRELQKMYSIRLDNNQLKTISSSAFMSNKQLKVLDLSQNQLVFSGKKSPFTFIDELKELSLKYNNLTAIPSGLENKKNMFVLDLGFNNITSFKYGRLRDATIVYTPRGINDETEYNLKLHKVHLNNNTLRCDCCFYDILSMKDKTHDALLNHMFAICIDLDDEMVSGWCVKVDDSSMKCPDQCTCKERYRYETNVTPRIIECDYRKLTTVPSIEHLKSYSLELYINNNNIEELPNLQRNLYVIVIQASHNNIRNIKVENLPPNLRALDVSQNKIKRISANVLDAINNLKSLEIMFLSDNPFECDCSTDTEKLIEFIEEKISITDLQDVKTQCQVSGVPYEFSSKVFQDLCWKETKTTLLIVLTTMLVIIGILVILLYKYKQILLIWLYYHNVFMWCVDEDELDKDKKFDAFITCSFGGDDEIAARIANELEDDSLRFKVCVDERDWMPGKPIAQLIAESMEESRRTIIILSKNFLKSMWGEHEFHCAYANGLAEKRMRLIIVLCEDIGNIEELDPTTKSYLKAHTCIKWGDSWFWEKLRYALPRRED